jgi:hypothetical protein
MTELTCSAGCEHKEGSKPLWPLNQEPFVKLKQEAAREQDTAESIAIMGCSWGSGHKQATLSIAEIMQAEGMHPVTIDIPDEMLADPDVPVGGPPSAFSVQNVFNTLLKEQSVRCDQLPSMGIGHGWSYA